VGGTATSKRGKKYPNVLSQFWNRRAKPEARASVKKKKALKGAKKTLHRNGHSPEALVTQRKKQA